MTTEVGIFADLTIRTANLDDIDEVADFIRNAWIRQYPKVYDHEFYQKHATFGHYRRKWWDFLIDRFEHPEKQFFVIYHGYDLIGVSACLEYQPVGSFKSYLDSSTSPLHGKKVGEFTCTYLAPEYQRHGIGTMFYIARIKHLLKHDYPVACVWADHTNASLPAFEALGGQKFGERTFLELDIVPSKEIGFFFPDLKKMLRTMHSAKPHLYDFVSSQLEQLTEHPTPSHRRRIA